MDREWKTKRQKLTLLSYESKKQLNTSLFVLHSSLYLVSSSAQSVVEVHDSLHLVEVVSNL